jgi:putative copper export protein
LRTLLIWVHLLAAISWIGGMVFLSLVLAPVYRSGGQTKEAAGLFRAAARRFRAVVWSAVAILLLTGPLLAIDRGWALFEPARWPSPLGAKLCLVGALLAAVGLHDFVVGPRIRSVLAIPPGGRTGVDWIIVMSASWLPRIAVALASGVVLAAAILARS